MTSPAQPGGSRLAARRFPGSEAAFVAAGQALSALGALVGVRLLTHAMQPAAYGELALAMSGVTLLQQGLYVPINAAALRYYSPAHDTADVHAYASALRRMTLGATIIVLAVSVVVAGLLIEYQQSARLPVLTAAVVFTILLGASVTIDGIQNAARRRLVTAWHDTFAGWSRFLVAVAVIRLAHSDGSAAAMAGYACSAVLVYVSQRYLFPPPLLREPHSPSDTVLPMQRRMLQYAVPLAFLGLTSAMQVAADRWALGLYVSASEVGHYAVVVQLGYYPLITCTNFLVQLATPIIFTRAGDGTDPRRARAARQLIWLFLAGVLLLTLILAAAAGQLSAYVFRLLATPSYAAAAPMLPYMVIVAGLQASGQVAGLALLVETRSKALIAPKICAGALAILGSLIGARLYGIRGVIAAGAFAASLYVLWVLLLARTTGESSAI